MTEGLAVLAGRLFNRQTLFFWLAAAALAIVLLIHLGSLPGGLSPAESSAAAHSQRLHSIAKNPVNAPHDILSLGLGNISGGLFFHRLSSAIWGIVFAAAFFSIAKSLFGKTIGLVGAVVFAATPLFLVAARQSSAEIMLVAPVLMMAAYAWLSRTHSSKPQALTFLIIAGALTFYVPGMIWWLLGGSIAGSKKIEEAARAVSRPRLYASLAAGLVILVPLLLALVSDWQLIKQLALVPAHFSSVFTELKHIGWMAAAWFFKTPYHSPLFIGRLPLLSIVQDALLVFGALALFQAARSKAWWLAAAIIFATLAAGLNDRSSLLLLGLPAAGLFMAAGLRFLYVEWRGIFPRNPAAKYLAITLIAGLGAVQLLYGVRYAVVAWPHTVATRQTYVIR